MHRPILHLLTAVAVHALSPIAAIAQDVSAPPIHGNLSIAPGLRTLQSAKVELRVDYPVKQAGCATFTSQSPTFNFDYRADGSSLRITGVGANGNFIHLLVRAPDGRWHCDNNEVWNPIVTLSSPQTGKYHIWLGLPDNQGTKTFQTWVNITQSATGSANGGGSITLDPDAKPRFGAMDNVLVDGRDRDIYASIPEAGGVHAVPSSLGGQCSGYVSGSAPDLEYDWGWETNSLERIWASENVRLIVKTPDGRWVCGEAAWGGDVRQVANVGMVLGKYSIWVGTINPWPVVQPSVMVNPD